MARCLQAQRVPKRPPVQCMQVNRLEHRSWRRVDGFEAAEISESNGVIEIVAPEECEFTMKEQDVARVVAAIGMTGVRAKVRFSASVASGPPPAAKLAAADDATERAMANPTVKRFQETFPDSLVRSVRNLKE